MIFVGVELCSFPVVPGNDSAQPLFPLNLTFVRRLEIRSQNLVANVHSLMRALVIIVRQPLSVDVVKLVEAYTEKVIQTFSFNLFDMATPYIRHLTENHQLWVGM